MILVSSQTRTVPLVFKCRTPYQSGCYAASINQLLEGALADHQSVWMVPGTVED